MSLYSLYVWDEVVMDGAGVAGLNINWDDADTMPGRVVKIVSVGLREKKNFLFFLEEIWENIQFVSA